ncbi:hypothetical protein DAPPUDRAFT_263306 [Daphnia pulex]|uniref:Uncharacterized protein n=1 Tax=Daphnia pulex TaxID=6669 RepID=E9HPH9_DAPPU|nr:hypothetical protein DAPPUDRAFT_263306 [Daphnia pulex]|eukprot:EFX66360.1 hypothetical protein DAPPUDRAFT_263306 [Daphnia pulex]
MDCIFCENEGQLWMSPDVHYICETVSGFQLSAPSPVPPLGVRVDIVKNSFFPLVEGGDFSVNRIIALIRNLRAPLTMQ